MIDSIIKEYDINFNKTKSPYMIMRKIYYKKLKDEMINKNISIHKFSLYKKIRIIWNKMSINEKKLFIDKYKIIKNNQINNTILDINHKLICPLSKELMVEPVIADDSCTYERFEIMKWIENNEYSPFDKNCKIKYKNLVVNKSVKNTIITLIKENKISSNIIAKWKIRKKYLSNKYNTYLSKKAIEEKNIKNIICCAINGITNSIDYLSDLYFNGILVKKNINQSLKWCFIGAEKNNVNSQCKLGLAYSDGIGNLKKNYSKAVYWYSKAAKQNNTDSMNSLGVLYYNGGYGITKDIQKSFEWFKKSAEQNNAFGLYNLSLNYLYGEGVKKNTYMAKNLMTKASLKGDIESKRILANMYFKGIGCQIDILKSIQLWNEASKQGDIKSKKNLKMIKNIDLL